MEDKQVTRQIILHVTMADPDLHALHDLLTAVEKLPGVTEALVLPSPDNQCGLTFERELEKLINRRSLESGSNTPDFILASFIKSCLVTWDLHTRERDRWFGNRSVLGPGNNMPAVETSSESLLKSSTPAIDQMLRGDGPDSTDGTDEAVFTARMQAAWQAPPFAPLDIPMGLKGAINQVYLFHEKFGVPWYTDDPQWPGPKRVALRERLMRDERNELVKAWDALNQYLLGAGYDDTVVRGFDGPDSFNTDFRKYLAAVAREMVDEIYTIIGTAGEFGIDLAAVWDVVHRANMAKVGGGKDDQGKVLKPEGWQEPDVEGAIFT
jgi:predicted HAD superfamily Cof-like phosphohydrolase